MRNLYIGHETKTVNKQPIGVGITVIGQSPLERAESMLGTCSERHT